MNPYQALVALDQPVYVVRAAGGVRLGPELEPGAQLLAYTPPLPPQRLGSAEYRAANGVRFAYQAGAMATGIAAEELVIALADAGFLASFGAAGLEPARIEQAVVRLGRELAGRPWASNLIMSPHAPELEAATVDLYLKHQVRLVEASAFVQLTPALVRYRVAGLRAAPDGTVSAENRLVAKVSRTQTAELFLRPAPAELLTALVEAGAVTPEQAALAARIPLADDITAEADSAGHTDRRPLSVLLPELVALRDRVPGAGAVRIGAAGGLGTPRALAAAFALGADYVVTGSVNQACAESGTSEAARELLRAAGPTDVAMAPAADMFELGAQVQVLRRGVMFPGRAHRLYRLYQEYPSLDALPAAERDRLETQLLRRPLPEVAAETEAYLGLHQPGAWERADAKQRMALVFRWYLGLSARWASTGEPDRLGDYQIWCGPAMGACNDWLRGSALERDRPVAELARHLMTGAAFHTRLHQLRLAGVRLPADCGEYRLPAG